MPKIQTSDLPPEHRAALKAYALRNGRFWKRKLLGAWSTGRDARRTRGTASAPDPQPPWPLAPAGPQPFSHRLTQNTQGQPYARHHPPLRIPGSQSFRRPPVRHGHRRARSATTRHHRKPPRNHRRHRSLRTRNSRGESNRQLRGFGQSSYSAESRAASMLKTMRLRSAGAPSSDRMSTIPRFTGASSSQSPPNPRSGVSRRCPRSQRPG